MFEARSTAIIRRLLLIVVFGSVTLTFTSGVWDPARTARFEVLERDHERLSYMNQRLMRTNLRLEEELDALNTTRLGWEMVARREHGLLLEGEVIFRFPTAQVKQVSQGQRQRAF